MMDSSMDYEVLRGALDDGRPYEFKLAALLCLRSLDEETEDMWLAMNSAHCGKFDDIIFYRKARSSNGIVYLIQSKHQTNPTPLSWKEFAQQLLNKKTKSKLYIKDYLESLEDIKNKISNNSFRESQIINHLRQPYDKIFIIFTNRKAPTKCDFLKNSDLQPNLQTVSTGGDTYLFDYSRLGLQEDKTRLGAQDFSEKLYLLAGQPDVKQLDKIIESTIEKIISPIKLEGRNLCNVAEKFLAIITNWSKGLLGGHYTITKNQIRKILIDLIIERYQFEIKPAEATTDFKTAVWTDLVSDKNVTVITNCDGKVEDFVNAWICSIVKKYIEGKKWEKLWNGGSRTVSQIFLRPMNISNEISFVDAYELLWKTGEIPLVLSFNNISTFKVLDIFQNAFKVVVLSEMSEADVPKLNNNIFINPNALSQQHRKQILQQSVTIQGRVHSIQLQEILDDTLFEMITVKDIIYILRGNFNIGDKFAPLPNFFMKRSLSKILLKIKVLKELSKREVFVIECTTVSCFQEFLNDHSIYIEESNIFVCEKSEDVNKIQQQSIIVTSDRNMGYAFLHQLTKKVVHYLVLHLDNNLEWISSNGDVKNIRPFRIHSETSYSKNEIANTFCNTINPLLCLIGADPGMGKTVLFDNIALSVPTSMWIIKINLADHWQYYEENEEFNSSQVIEYFFQNVSCSLAKQAFAEYLKSKKILFLLDGFDEILSDFQTQALKLIQCLQKSQYSICVATRPISTSFLEEGLQTFAVAIRPFNREDQESFLTKYFLSSVKNSSNNRNRVISFVEKLLSATEKNLNNSSFTSVPLQIFLIAEKFHDECAKFVETKLFINQQFDLLSLYEEFLKKKAQIAYDRFKIYSQSFKKEIENYRKLYALKVLFVKSDLEQLNIGKQLNHCSVEKLHLVQIDGVIVVRNKSDITFVHRTFAEYLAALWLADVNNLYCTKILFKKIFHPNYKVLRNIFDRIVARGSRIHTAILDRKLETVIDIVKSNPEALDELDKMGRTYLHLLASWDVNHPSDYAEDIVLEFVNWMNCGIDEIIKETPEGILNMSLNKVFSVLNISDLNKNQVVGAFFTNDMSIKDFLEKLQYKRTIQHFNLYQWAGNLSNMIFISLDNIKEFCNNTCINNDITLISSYRFDSSNTGKVTYYNIIDNVKKYVIENLKDDSSKSIANMVLNCIFYMLLPLLKKSIGLDIVKLRKCDNSLVYNTSEEYNRVLDNFILLFKESHTATKFFNRIKNFRNVDLETLLSKFFSKDRKFDSLLNEFFSKASKFDKLNSVLLRIENMSIRRNILSKELENDTVSNTIRCILKDTTNKDIGKEVLDIFNFSPLDYAIISCSLSAADVICTQGISRITIDEIDVAYILCNCSELLYGSLVTTVIKHHIDTDINKAFNKRKIASNCNKYLLGTNIKKNAERCNLKLFLDDAEIIQKNDTGTAAIHIASSFGYTNIIQQILSKRNNIGEKDHLGMTALHWAASKGHEDTMTLLLSRGADVDAVDHKNMTPLLHVIFSTSPGKTNLVQLLLRHGANINANDCTGNSALLNAVICNDIQMATLLIEHGANVNSIGYVGLTALHWCARYGHLKLAKLLLENGADTEIVEMSYPDIRGIPMTAIQHAAKNGHFNIVKLLIDHYKSKGSDEYKQGLILIEAAKYGQTDIVKSLLSRGVDTNATDDENKTALHWVVQFRHFETFTTLLNYSPELGAVDNRKMTALHWAAHAGFTEAVLELLAKNVDKNARDMFGRTPLIVAATNDYTDTLIQFLHNGAEINSQDNHGLTALHLAASKGQLLAATALLSHGADVNLKDNQGMHALQWAAYYGHVNVTNFLVSNGADLEMKDNKSGRTALITASARGYPGFVKALLANGANVLAVNEEHRTALHVAALKGQRRTAEELLCKGADVNAKDSYGKSPLLLAAKYGFTEVIDELLSNGANIHSKDNQQATALHLAACYNFNDTVKMLVDKGANTEEKDVRCMTPLHWAMYKGNSHVVLLLLNHIINIEGENRSAGKLSIITTVNNYNTILSFLLNGASTSTNSKNIRNMTALHFAARKGYTQIVETLLYTRSFLEAKDECNTTPLILAASQGHVDTVKLLLLWVANINAHDQRNMTALHWASLKGHATIVDLLLAKGADTKVRNAKGRNALILAAAKGHDDVVNLLLLSSDIHIKDHGNATALQWAEHKGHRTVVDLLRKKLTQS